MAKEIASKTLNELLADAKELYRPGIPVSPLLLVNDGQRKHLVALHDTCVVKDENGNPQIFVVGTAIETERPTRNRGNDEEDTPEATEEKPAKRKRGA